MCVSCLQHNSLFTPQAYEEVQDFFGSSPPASVFSVLAKALDSKCQAVNEISALLKDLTADKSRASYQLLGVNVTRQ